MIWFLIQYLILEEMEPNHFFKFRGGKKHRANEQNPLLQIERQSHRWVWWLPRSREVMENQWNQRNQPMSSIPQSNLTIRNTCPNFYNYREHFIINSLTSKVYMELGQTQGQFKERITSSITNLTWSSPLSFQPFWVPDVLFSSSYNRFPELHKITNT